MRTSASRADYPGSNPGGRTTLAEGHIEAKATLTSTATYAVRPLEKLLDVGLHLLEIGMPVLITGLVLYVGLPSTL